MDSSVLFSWGEAYLLKLYYANINLLQEQEIFEKWLEKVNKQRREKVLRCKQDSDRNRALLAGILLRKSLESEGILYDEVEVSITSEGKPVLRNIPEMNFNISHSGEYVCCVISNRVVGVDLECSKKSIMQDGKETRLRNVAKKCLSLTEWEKFCQVDEIQKKALFLEYWTKKEAYSKAMGKGLQMNFSQIDTETNEKYWTMCMKEGYCVSIYTDDENYEDLLIEEIKEL